MATEIELKVRIGNPEALRKKAAALWPSRGAYDKIDAYWRSRDGGRDLGSGVRVRRDGLDPGGAGAEVTFKRKEVRDGIEVNDEREFGVSDAAAFEDLLGRLGLEVGARKRKAGEAWDADGATAELSLVEGLGWFLELEVLAADDGDATVKAARRRLEALLGKLGLAGVPLETRYYTEMLEELRRDRAASQPSEEPSDSKA